MVVLTLSKERPPRPPWLFYAGLVHVVLFNLVSKGISGQWCCSAKSPSKIT